MALLATRAQQVIIDWEPTLAQIALRALGPSLEVPLALLVWPGHMTTSPLVTERHPVCARLALQEHIQQEDQHLVLPAWPARTRRLGPLHV